MKNSRIIAVAVLVLLGVGITLVHGVVAPNLVTNGGFESGVAGWTPGADTNAAAVSSFSTLAPFEGDFMALVTQSDPSADSITLTSAPFALPAGITRISTKGVVLTSDPFATGPLWKFSLVSLPTLTVIDSRMETVRPVAFQPMLVPESGFLFRTGTIDFHFTTFNPAPTTAQVEVTLERASSLPALQFGVLLDDIDVRDPPVVPFDTKPSHAGNGFSSFRNPSYPLDPQDGRFDGVGTQLHTGSFTYTTDG